MQPTRAQHRKAWMHREPGGLRDEVMDTQGSVDLNPVHDHGAIAGVGQGTGTFLKPGDIVEAEAGGIGRQRNRVVAEPH